MNNQPTSQDSHEPETTDPAPPTANGFDAGPHSLDAHADADVTASPSLEANVHSPPIETGEPSSGAFTSTNPLSQGAPTVETEIIPLEERLRRLEQSLNELRGAKAPVATPLPIPVARLVTELPARTVPRRQPLAATGIPSISRRAWLLWELYAEARVIVRMYVDPRYYMSWTGRFLPIGLLLLFLTSAWWNPLAYIPWIGSYLDKATDLVVCFVLFKVLGHEARRYRETSPDLPHSLRL